MKITIPVSVGELLDKITILEIKSLLCYDEYVKKELEDLNQIKDTISSYVDDYMNQLRKVNQSLWKIEDRLRVLEKEQRFDNEFIELARSAYKLNDQRAEIKKKSTKKLIPYIKRLKFIKINTKK